MLLIANHKPCQVDNGYEHVRDRQLYGIQVYSTLYIIYSKLAITKWNQRGGPPTLQSDKREMWAL